MTRDKKGRFITLNKECSISGCEQKHYAKGLCFNHYMQKRRYGRTYNIISPKIAYRCLQCGKIFLGYKNAYRKFCSVSCMKQYQIGKNAPHWQGGKTVYVCQNCGQIIKDLSTIKRKFCSTICMREYQKRENHPQWNGGRKITTDGSIAILNHSHPHTTQDGYVLEHRLVMEKIIGRFLKPEEVVHHINKNRQDNHPENLILFKNNGEHCKHHKKLRDQEKSNLSTIL